MTDIIKSVSVVNHEDGSATYTFDMTENVSLICGELGLKLLLYCGMLEKSPEYAFELLGAEIDNMLKKEEDND